MNRKEITQQSYDEHAEEFDGYFQSSFNKEGTANDISEFLKLNPGPKILDLGSGSGIHAKFFADKGFDVTCLDISEPLLEKCRQRGLKTIQMDLEELILPKETYDAVWAVASLLHVSRRKVPKVVREIYKTLKPMGLLVVAVKEGKGGEYVVSSSISGVRRWFVYFSKEEIEKLFGPYFEITNFSKYQPGDRAVFLHFVMRKK